MNRAPVASVCGAEEFKEGSTEALPVTGVLNEGGEEAPTGGGESVLLNGEGSCMAGSEGVDGLRDELSGDDRRLKLEVLLLEVFAVVNLEPDELLEGVSDMLHVELNPRAPT